MTTKNTTKTPAQRVKKPVKARDASIDIDDDEDDDQAATVVDAPTPLDQLMNALDAIDGDGREGKIIVSRYNGARVEYLDDFVAAGFSERVVKERFGGGKYQVKATRPNGTYLRSVTIVIAGEPKHEAPTPPPAAPVVVAPVPASIVDPSRADAMLMRMLETQATELRAELRESRKRMDDMIEKSLSRPTGPTAQMSDFEKMFEAVKSLSEKMTPPSTGSDSIAIAQMVIGAVGGLADRLIAAKQGRAVVADSTATHVQGASPAPTLPQQQGAGQSGPAPAGTTPPRETNQAGATPQSEQERFGALIKDLLPMLTRSAKVDGDAVGVSNIIADAIEAEGLNDWASVAVTSIPPGGLAELIAHLSKPLEAHMDWLKSVEVELRETLAQLATLEESGDKAGA